ncbi:MAG: methylated-DNA--[protein]-cysteine S-methyltransferase [Magnetococcales bacterium]|nr:methylated-DNA--[protein]-cysteine S-methyltransferase [Magnetococcales bacterium]
MWSIWTCSRLYATPLGPLWLHTRDQAIVALATHPPALPAEGALQERVGAWLRDFFSGIVVPALTDLPLAPEGTPFQRRVWGYLATIPPGRVATYGALAQALDTSPRAVGNALAANPIPILIPCHRVVAAHGPGGYSGLGGVDGKRLLLALEGHASSQPGASFLS